MTRPKNGRRYLHVAVSDALRARILNREAPPGAILPSEKDLTEEFGVSRSVVRESLRTLAEEGHIQIVPGRGSVVIAHTEWHRDAQRTAGLSAQMRALGARVETRVLDYRVEREREQGRRLGCAEVLTLERLRLLDGEPVAYIRTWLPGWVAGKVAAEHLEDASLHVQMHERAGLAVHGGPRQIRAVGLSGDMAGHLAVPTGSAVLLLEGESLDQHGATIELFSTWHRSDRIALDITEVHASAAPGGQPGAVDGGSLRAAEEAALETLRQIRALASAT